LSTQETEGTRAWPAAGGQRMLASDADRDAAAGLLNAALAEGRLTADDDQRMSGAYAARTWQQLDQLTADLPARPAAATLVQQVPGMFAGADLCLLCVLLVACPPAGIAWLFFCWHRSRTDPDRRLVRTSSLTVREGL